MSEFCWHEMDRGVVCSLPQGHDGSHYTNARGFEHLNPQSRCEHLARIPELARCELEAGHAGDHRGNRGQINAWSHRADLPSASL